MVKAEALLGVIQSYPVIPLSKWMYGDRFKMFLAITETKLWVFTTTQGVVMESACAIYAPARHHKGNVPDSDR